MTEERLKEIKDSIDFQKKIYEIKGYELGIVQEEIDLYNEVITLKEEIERLKKELNKHIKEGIEKDQRIFNALSLITKVIVNSEIKGNSALNLNDLINILQGSDKE